MSRRPGRSCELEDLVADLDLGARARAGGAQRLFQFLACGALPVMR